MGYVQIVYQDGSSILFGDHPPTEVFDFCDLCNEPKPMEALANHGDLDKTWVCYRCKASNQR